MRTLAVTLALAVCLAAPGDCAHRPGTARHTTSTGTASSVLMLFSYLLRLSR